MVRLNRFSCTYDAKLWEVGKDRGAWRPTVHGVTKGSYDLATEQQLGEMSVQILYQFLIGLFVFFIIEL